MEKRCYYEILGLSRTADGTEIKKAYRQLAIKFHPDKNPDNAEAENSFKEASEAYQILGSSESRSRYDQFGHAAFTGGGGGGGFNDFSGFAEEIFGDIFGAFFGTQGGHGGRRAGRDLRYVLETTLEEAAAGLDKEITLTKPSVCNDCSGSGAAAGSSPSTCAQCKGQGNVSIQQGIFAISRPCSACSGSGQTISDPCKTCAGAGQEVREQKLSVKVPAGIDTGQRLKLRGEGEPSPNGGPAGDLYVEISIHPHKVFQRHGPDLICEVPITFSQATLGSEIDVPTLNGDIPMKIPAGTPSGKVFRLRGKGVVEPQTGGRGDQHVRVYVYVPQSITDEQRELIESLAKIEGKPIADESSSFFDRVKGLFD